MIQLADALSLDAETAQTAADPSCLAGPWHFVDVEVSVALASLGVQSICENEVGISSWRPRLDERVDAALDGRPGHAKRSEVSIYVHLPTSAGVPEDTGDFAIAASRLAV